MKSRSFLVALAACLILAATASSAVELRDATNQQLVDELSYRLRVGGGGSGNSSSISYLCDSSSYLKISIVGPSGTESSKQYYLGDSAYCSRQRAVLNTSRGRIERTTVIAICDSSYYLQRFSVTELGVVRDLSNNYIGDSEACFDQARSINIGT